MRPQAPLRRVLALRLAVAALVPIGAASLLVLWYLSVRRVSDIGERNLLLAGAIRGRVEAFLGESRASLEVLGEILESMSEREVREVELHLDAAVRGSRLFESIYLLGRDGKVLTAGVERGQVRARGDFTGIDLSHQAFIREAVASGRPAWSETFLSILSGHMTLAVCVPRERETLLGNFSLERLQHLVRGVEREGSVTASIVDRGGSIIAHPDAQVALRQVKVNQHRLVREALAGRPGSARLEFLGTDAIASAVRIEETGWVVVVSQRAADAYQPVWIAALGFAGVLLVSAGVALLFALTQSRRISGPLAALATQARSIARGGYEPAPTMGGILEVQELGESFRLMTEAVRERERLLREGEEKYRLLIENAGDAIFIAQEGRLAFANRRTEELAGRSGVELLSVPWGQLVHPEDRETLATRHRARVAGEELSPTSSFRVVRPGGEVRHVQMNSVLVQWAGRPATLNFARDLTELKSLEAQALQAQKMEAIGTLAGGVAHDFNNLLQAIQGSAELALLPGRDAAATRRILEQIVRASERGADLTRQLLAFSRKIESRRIPVRLNAEIEQVAGILRNTLPKMIRVELQLGALEGTVPADPGQIHQVLMNLAVNAAQAMPDGGILRIATAAVDVPGAEGAPPELAPGRYAEIVVADTGFGIEERHQPRIFEPFFTTKGPGRGTGLGLSMVLGIVREHDGGISFESVTGHGTTFRILLPLTAAGAAEARQATAAVPPEAVASAGVLVVDDEETVRSIAAEMLARHGYRVLTAVDGETALRLYRERREEIALVVLDVMMPGMGGKRCLRELLEFDPAAKVILASGYAGDEEGALPPAGGRGFVAKPFRMETLLAAVNAALSPAGG